MAIYYARKSGNVNAADVWATTPSGTASDVFSTFTNQDTLIANSFTVTLNVNTTVAEIRNDTTGGAVAGGSFSLANGITLISNIIGGASTCVTLASTSSATIIGNINGSTATNIFTVNVSSSGKLTIIGSITGGRGATSSEGVRLSGAGTIEITGNITGGTVNTGIGVNNAAGGTVIVTGNVVGGSDTGANGIYNAAGGNITITGSVFGGVISGAVGARNDGAGTLTVFGTSLGTAAIGTQNFGSLGTVIVTRAKGGPLVSSAVGVASSTGSTSVEEIEFGDLGASPTSGPIRLVDKTTNVAVMYRFGTTKKSLTDVSSTSLLPSTNNVRSGTIYNNGGSTGTCVIPNANSVVYGVPVDNTIGNAIISPGAFWNILTSSIGTSGSIGERLKNCSTVATVGKQLEGVL